MRILGIPFHQGRNDYTDADGMHYGIAIHNTSNTASDEAESSYADHRTDGTSAHFYGDADSVTQSLDTNDKAGHAGSREGNENAIAFEITGTNDKSRQWWLDNVAWARLGYVIAYILQHEPDYAGFQVRRASVAEMQANPKVKAFYGHDDMRRAWGGTDHTDPGGAFPWDRLFSAVNAALEGDDMDQSEQVTGLYTRGNRIGDGVADVSNERDWWYVAPGTKTNNPPPPGSRADLLFKAAQKLLDAPAGPSVLTDAQAAALADKVAAAVAAHPDNPLGDADKPAIVAAVKQALAEGVGSA